MEPQQLGQTLPTDTGVQLHPGPTDQQHPHQAVRQLPRTGTLYIITPPPGTEHIILVDHTT